MKIVRIRIRNFRCIQEAEIFPTAHNVLLGPNNIGKTAILEAINLVLNPEITMRPGVIDENDFFNREYMPQVEDLSDQSSQDAVNNESAIPPTIRIELVLAGLSQEEEDIFIGQHVAWIESEKLVRESSNTDEDPFEGAEIAIRAVFEGWYDIEEDDFDCMTFLLPIEGAFRENCRPLSRTHKRQIGFLIYRDFRALTRPITLNPSQLFNRLLFSHNVKPKHFEEALASVLSALEPMTNDGDFVELLNQYKKELERFLLLSESETSILGFQVTDGTRENVKSEAQMYVKDTIALPLQKTGAGIRSLSILAMLSLIVRRRQRGILALEEPETFLFPHAQRRVIDECIGLADQTFITTHSPYILERMPVEGVGRIDRDNMGKLTWSTISTSSVRSINLYSRRLKEVCSEALLGRGVVIVEGDSDKWWFLATSRIMNSREWRLCRQEALELIGVSIVSADTNSDILRLGSFFHDAGLKVIGVFDRVDRDSPLWTEAVDSPFPSIFHKESGLEKILSKELPLDILKLVLVSAPYSRTPAIDEATVLAMSEEVIRDKSFEMLKSNKGSSAMHEWIISRLDEASMPSSLKDLNWLFACYMSGRIGLGTCCFTPSENN